jgi:fumarylacetoacetate (FAA) hydrolase
MKLASLKSGSRDGALAVVARNLSKCVPVPRIAPTLQDAIETWSTTAPKLKAIYQHLNDGTAERAEPFSPERAESPFPRAYQFLDGSVYLSHMQKARKARGAEMPANFDTEPLMYQGMSDGFIGPVDDMLLPADDLGVDFEAEIAVVVDDVPIGTSAAVAVSHIKLVMLLNDFTLRTLTRSELPKGFGFMQAKPTSGFSPVAVTPDDLPQWDGQKLNVRLISSVNGRKVGSPHAGHDMFFTYPQLIAHAARTRRLGAGTIIGAGTVANKHEGSGSSCIAEIRANEELANGKASTPFLKFGDRVRIEVLDEVGRTIFGAIDQRVAKAPAAATE